MHTLTLTDDELALIRAAINQIGSRDHVFSAVMDEANEHSEHDAEDAWDALLDKVEALPLPA